MLIYRMCHGGVASRNEGHGKVRLTLLYALSVSNLKQSILTLPEIISVAGLNLIC